MTYLWRRGEPEGTAYQLDRDVRLHGFHFGRFWVVSYRDRRAEALLRMDLAALRRWIADLAAEAASP